MAEWSRASQASMLSSRTPFSREIRSTARMTSLLIVILTMGVASITLFDQWAILNDVTYQNNMRNSSGVVAEILCVMYLCVESASNHGDIIE